MTEGQLSDTARPEGVTAALHIPRSVFWVTLAGHVRVGSSLSLTVIEKLQVAEFPAASVAV